MANRIGAWLQAGFLCLLGAFGPILPIHCQELPVLDPSLAGHKEDQAYGVRNSIGIEQLYRAIQDGDEEGLGFDLSGIKTLLDGSIVDASNIYGTLAVGPEPFEALETDYAYGRLRRKTPLEQGQGLIDLAYLLEPSHNAEGWEKEGEALLRAELFMKMPGKDRPLGMYDVPFRFGFQGAFRKLPGISTGPFVSLVSSDRPGSVTVCFETAEPVQASVIVDGRRFEDKEPTKDHAINISGLRPGTVYSYRVAFKGYTSRHYALKTAPLPADNIPVAFAYTGDSREGVGGGQEALMGVNHLTFERLANLAYRKEADFLLFGGDLFNGYTSSVEDFETQLFSWKRAVSGFWHERAVYPVMGNHESLLRVFNGGDIRLDRWPYATDSAEALFARAFNNPNNGPETSDARRPSYKENVYSFQYGPVYVIAFNNNYWASFNEKEFGGSPEGYILEDQMAWIESEVKRAENDPSVRFVVLFAQEPVIPNGGHTDDAMWYSGDNNVRAYTMRSGSLTPESKGIVEVRNELIRLVAASPKVACVLGSDEHAYHRTLISKDVPLGDPKKDDANKNGVVCEQGESCSALDVGHPTWFITSGGAGAPYYAEEPTPWNAYLKAHRPGDYFYSSQANILIFQADGGSLGLEVYNPYGQRIDTIEDLMAHKKE